MKIAEHNPIFLVQDRHDGEWPKTATIDQRVACPKDGVSAILERVLNVRRWYMGGTQ